MSGVGVLGCSEESGPELSHNCLLMAEEGRPQGARQWLLSLAKRKALTRVQSRSRC